MAHKTLIDGTAYEISGGKTLIDGAAYSIKNGKTLVDGTAYEVEFGLPMVVVTVIGDAFESDYCEASTTYSTPDGDTGELNTAGAYELPIGTIICCDVYPNYYSSTRPNGYIYLNGEIIDGGDSGAYYEHTLTTNTTIKYVNNFYSGGDIYITEIPEGHQALWIGFCSPEFFSVSVNGVNYNDATITVPIGSVVEISAFNLYCRSCKRDGTACVYFNGNLVSEEAESITYSYTVTGDADIRCVVNPSTHSDCSYYSYYGCIYITEY